MTKYIAIVSGGGIGALCRHLTFLATQRLFGPNFPGGTLSANMAGCFLIGFLWSLFEVMHISNQWRLFIFTGFLGAFTTFSTFARESTQLMMGKEWKSAIIYLSISNVLGVILVFTGYLLAKKLIMSA